MSAHRKWHFRIEHILEAIAKIQRYTAGMSAAAFAADRLEVDAVERDFTVIGEAARQIPTEIQAKHPDIPWALIKERQFEHLYIHSDNSTRRLTTKEAIEYVKSRWKTP